MRLRDAVHRSPTDRHRASAAAIALSKLTRADAAVARWGHSRRALSIWKRHLACSTLSMLVLAKSVIAQDFDDPAFGGRSAT